MTKEEKIEAIKQRARKNFTPMSSLSDNALSSATVNLEILLTMYLWIPLHILRKGLR